MQGGHDRVGVDAPVGGLVVVDEQRLVKQEALGGAPLLKSPAAA
jgi:hypothetical protein